MAKEKEKGARERDRDEEGGGGGGGGKREGVEMRGGRDRRRMWRERRGRYKDREDDVG